MNCYKQRSCCPTDCVSLCLTGIQCPAPLSPVTRPCWATTKASSTTNNGAGLYDGSKQTADCPLVLIRPYSVLSQWCHSSFTNTCTHMCIFNIYFPSLQWFAEEKGILAIVTFISPYTKMAPLYSCSSIHHSLSIHLPSIHRFIHPSLHPSIHLPALRPLHPLSIALFLFVVDAERVAQSPSGPNSQKDPWINSNIHLPPPALPPSSSNPAACAWAAPPVCFLLRIPTVDHV